MKFTDKVVEQYQDMIYSIAWAYTDDPVLHKDLAQEGFIGLRKACEQYNPDRAKFSTYAYRKAQAQMQQYLNYKNATVHIPIKRKDAGKVYCVSLDGGPACDVWDNEHTNPLEELIHCDQQQRSRAECASKLQIIEEHMSGLLIDHYYGGVSVTRLAEMHNDTRENIRQAIQEGLQELRELV